MQILLLSVKSSCSRSLVILFMYVLLLQDRVVSIVKKTTSNRIKFDMRIHNSKLRYRVEYISVLMQERIGNICRVSIIVPNRMQEMELTIKYIYFK